MSSRRVIRDSDDEDDDAGLSPQKPCAVPARPETTTPYVDLRTSSPTEAGLHVHSGHDRSTGSTELLSQAIHNAHQSLLEPSPDTMPSAQQSGMRTLLSPTVSKVQRRKTTMEAFSSDSRVGKSKGLKTYEGKRNRDMSRYEESDEETNLLDLPSQNKKILQRRATTGPESTPSDDSMLPPILANRSSQQGKGSGSVSSTIPNTSIEPPRSMDLAAALPSTSSGRMPTPTISAASLQHLSNESTGHAETAKDEVKEDEQQPSSSAAVETKTMTEVLINSRMPLSNYEAHDELALPPSAYKYPSSPPSKSGSKRKLPVSTTDELSSDDFAVGLPKEHYQPRPSRSRGSRTVDDSVLATDYSARPEVLARKIKRRKTTGTQVGTLDERDQGPIDFPSMTTDRFEDSAVVIDEDAVAPKHKLKQVRDVERLAEPLYEDQVSVPDAVPAKKRRGRPKKQVEQEFEGKPLCNVEEPVDQPDPAHENPAEASAAPAKSGRSRRKTAEAAVVISEEIVVEDDELTFLSQHGNDLAANVLEANENAANVRTDAAPISKGPETPKKEASKGPNQHSPLNTSRIRYRVGLSKRVRIEPLLKVVRK